MSDILKIKFYIHKDYSDEEEKGKYFFKTHRTLFVTKKLIFTVTNGEFLALSRLIYIKRYEI